MKVELKWITPDAEALIVQMARVSTSMANDANDDRLLAYLRKHQHWSPFEMASACVYIEADRAVTRQILRHRSFSFQEFSQRYAEVQFLEGPEARADGATNRQSSVAIDDPLLEEKWWRIKAKAKALYFEARNLGIAKEVARAVAPEGLAVSRLFMAGTLRSWIHYCDLRTQPDTQKEHREIAEAIRAELSEVAPKIFPTGENHA